MSLIFKCPINSLSFGNVAYNIIRQLYKKNIDTKIFPHGNVDISAFDKMEEGLKNWVQESINNRYSNLDKDLPTLSLWHINGSENRISKNQNLLTFYETDEPTEQEKTLVNFQDHVFFSSSHAVDCFKDSCENISFCPMGFDEDFHVTDKQYLSNDIIHFGLIGKYEKRKNHDLILKAWADRYGDNNKFRLTCVIENPFFKKGELNQRLNILFGGKTFSNISFLPRLKTNSEVNDFLNAIDIDLSGMSGAEGWNLPAFNSTCLGKWSLVLNHTSHKDWANSENAIIVEPSNKALAHDGQFFNKGAPYNQGSINLFEQDAINEAFEKAESLAKQKNEKGLDTANKFTYSNTVEILLKSIM